MKLGIIGLEQAGKATVFEALTGADLTPGARTESHIGTIRVPDERVDTLSTIYNDKIRLYSCCYHRLTKRYKLLFYTYSEFYPYRFCAT